MRGEVITTRLGGYKMRHKLETYLCTSIFLLSCPAISLGCSLLLRPLKEFDMSQYVFIGEVVNIVGKDVAEGIEGEAIGLRVKVTEMVYSPGPSVPYFEVFPLRLTPSCGSMYWERDDIHRQFPVGSQVKVIAGGPAILDRDHATSAIRLEVTAENGAVSPGMTWARGLSPPPTLYTTIRALQNADPLRPLETPCFGLIDTFRNLSCGKIGCD